MNFRYDKQTNFNRLKMTNNFYGTSWYLILCLHCFRAYNQWPGLMSKCIWLLRIPSVFFDLSKTACLPKEYWISPCKRVSKAGMSNSSQDKVIVSAKDRSLHPVQSACMQFHGVPHLHNATQHTRKFKNRYTYVSLASYAPYCKFWFLINRQNCFDYC